MPHGTPGRVVLLNGPSSSGKSSIGRALQPLLPGPWFLFPVDALGAMRSSSPDLEPDALDVVLRRTRQGYHRAVAALVGVGLDVVMDYPLSEPWRLADLLDVLAGVDLTLVDVCCSPDELDRRERARGDRPSGLARSQTSVYAHDDRDIVVDTTTTAAEECAHEILGLLDTLTPPKAFDRLRARSPASGDDAGGRT